MSKRFIDLSIYLENDVISDPPFMRPEITYQSHHETMPEAQMFSRRLRQKTCAAARALPPLKRSN